jgi:ATP synthase protein I
MAVDWLKAAKYSAIGTEFVSPIIVGPVIGHYLDLHYKTDPMFTLVCFFLGLFAGGYNLVREVRNFQRDSRQ